MILTVQRSGSLVLFRKRYSNGHDPYSCCRDFQSGQKNQNLMLFGVSAQHVGDRHGRPERLQSNLCEAHVITESVQSRDCLASCSEEPGKDQITLQMDELKSDSMPHMRLKF
jgi:hypothetical protein